LRLTLEKIPGIGIRRRQVLLDYCHGDLSIIANAELEDLSALKGIHLALANEIRTFVRRELGND
jgi:excinuclease UvrABC nuclease subunit